MLQTLTPNFLAVNQAVSRSGLLTKLCTITTPPDSDTFNLAGGMDPTTPWAPLAGHVNLPCMDAPLQTGDRVTETEQKTAETVMSVNNRHVFLNGYYPLIISTYRATIDSIEYDITNAEADSQTRTTRLALLKATI